MTGFALHNVIGAGFARPLSPVEVGLNILRLRDPEYGKPKPKRPKGGGK